MTTIASTNIQDLLDFIDASPSPWHVVATSSERLTKAGFKALNESEAWQIETGGRYFVTRGGSSIIAFTVGQNPLPNSGLNMVGAHTDSPGLRLKPHAAFSSDGLIRIGVEVYGGPILATFADRDLSIAGRVNVRTANGFETRLIKFDKPLLRLPNLAIHMNREVNDKGLKFNKQTELPLLFGESANGVEADAQFLGHIAKSIKVEVKDIINFELNVFDTQKGIIWGANQEFIADSQLDNLASCHAALSALLANKKPNNTAICALFDHEEVGSESATGASGSFLADIVERISLHLNKEEKLRTLANSFFISADMAHAFHPNHAGSYEPCHHVHINKGPVIKTNANQRYATNAESAARFIRLCEQAGVPYQQYAHRTDLGCGSTIGPIVASRLGIASVDVGSPMWAMHSIRESAGVLDHAYMIKVLTTYYS
ncbi:MAG: putative family aminopeptidase 2 [Pseudomonadota bacterium]|jgi:aspartyl aminopeptidase